MRRRAFQRCRSLELSSTAFNRWSRALSQTGASVRLSECVLLVRKDDGKFVGTFFQQLRTRSRPSLSSYRPLESAQKMPPYASVQVTLDDRLSSIRRWRRRRAR